jgi:hypothetical protein
LKVFENRMLRPMAKEVTEGWGKFSDEWPRKLYCTPNIVTVFKLRRMGWTDYIVRKAKARNA